MADQGEERNAICCADMCVAISGGDMRLYKDGPGLPGEEAPTVSFCPFCGTQYLPIGDGDSDDEWGWRLVRIAEDDEAAE